MPSHDGTYPETIWSSILRDRAADAQTQRRLLERLLESYWPPLYCAARHGWHLSPQDAEDAVQGFYLDLVERTFLEDIDPQRGRLRSFLKACFSNYLRNRKRRAGRLKRGGGARPLSLEGAEELVAGGDDPDAVFDAAWLQLVLSRALDAYRAESRGALAYAVFEAYELTGEARTYAAVAAELGIDETAVRNRLHAARKRLRELVLREIRTYALDAQDAADEVRWMIG